MKKLFILIFFSLFLYSVNSATIQSIDLVPDLNITRFLPYRADVNITEINPSTNVKILISAINGEGRECWDYFVDGTCDSEVVERQLIYNNTTGFWDYNRIYPDTIYPEIYFAPSDITWYEPPTSTPMWRRNYHILKMTNSFEMDKNMSFWVEFDATPRNTNNSGILEVYIVGEGENLTYFESDWRNKANTQLVGTVSRNDSKHHIHTENSSHHLIPLSTNNWGNIGDKNISIDNDFYIILYQDSTNTNRGWDLNYRPQALCDNTNNWFVADRSGGNTWNTPIHQNGCPDSHIHIARREDYVDGVSLTIQVLDDGNNIVEQESKSFYFIEVPNWLQMKLLLQILCQIVFMME
jgi:hypothetical protein